jgi:hypothetical protein
MITKLSMCLQSNTSHHEHQEVEKLCTRWRWVVSLTLCPKKNDNGTHWIGGPTAGMGAVSRNGRECNTIDQPRSLSL